MDQLGKRWSAWCLGCALCRTFRMLSFLQVSVFRAGLIYGFIDIALQHHSSGGQWQGSSRAWSLQAGEVTGVLKDEVAHVHERGREHKEQDGIWHAENEHQHWEWHPVLVFKTSFKHMVVVVLYTLTSMVQCPIPHFKVSSTFWQWTSDLSDPRAAIREN